MKYINDYIDHIAGLKSCLEIAVEQQENNNKINVYIKLSRYVKSLIKLQETIQLYFNWYEWYEMYDDEDKSYSIMFSF